MPGCQKRPEKHKQPRCLTQQGGIFFKTTKLFYLCSEVMTNSFSGTLSAHHTHTFWQKEKVFLHQNAHWLSEVDVRSVAHLAGVRVNAVCLQHLSLLEEIELRRFWSLTSEKEKAKLDVILFSFQNQTHQD